MAVRHRTHPGQRCRSYGAIGRALCVGEQAANQQRHQDDHTALHVCENTTLQTVGHLRNSEHIPG